MSKADNLKLQIKKAGKALNPFLLVFSVLFAGMLEVSRHIFYSDETISTVETTYVTDFHFLDVIFILLLIPLVYSLGTLLLKGLKGISESFFQEKRGGKGGALLFLFSFVLLMLLWVPYLMSYWPGGIFSDTVDSINMALGKAEMDSHNPVLYTLIWKWMFSVTGAFRGNGEYGGLKLFTVVQMVLIALTLSGFLAWCYKRGIRRTYLTICLLVFATVPLYPFYGVSLWKDTIFSLVVFGYSLFLYSLTGEKQGKRILDLLLYAVLSVLVIFLRNNGIYIILFTSVILALILWRKKEKQLFRAITVTSLVVLIISAVIQGPVFNQKHYNIDRGTESFGIPLQQMAFIVSTGGTVAEEDLAVMSQIMPIENWQALYNPIVVDTMKFDPGFQKEYLEENRGEFLKTYFHIVKANPVKAVKAYLLATMGFWDIFEGSANAYVVTQHFGNVEYFMSDYFDYYTDISFKKLVEPKGYLSSAIWVWIMLSAFGTCLAKKHTKGIIAILPTLALWLTIMLATPIAFSLRYVYSLFLCVPLYFLIVLEALQKKQAD